MLRRPDIPSTLPRNTSTKDGKRRRSQAKGAGIRDARRCICKPAKATTCQGASHPHSLSAPRWNAGKGEEGLVPIQFKLAPFAESQRPRQRRTDRCRYTSAFVAPISDALRASVFSQVEFSVAASGVFFSRGGRQPCAVP